MDHTGYDEGELLEEITLDPAQAAIVAARNAFLGQIGHGNAADVRFFFTTSNSSRRWDEVSHGFVACLTLSAPAAPYVRATLGHTTSIYRLACTDQQINELDIPDAFRQCGKRVVAMRTDYAPAPSAKPRGRKSRSGASPAPSPGAPQDAAPESPDAAPDVVELGYIASGVFLMCEQVTTRGRNVPILHNAYSICVRGTALPAARRAMRQAREATLDEFMHKHYPRLESAVAAAHDAAARQAADTLGLRLADAPPLRTVNESLTLGLFHPQGACGLAGETAVLACGATPVALDTPTPVAVWLGTDRGVAVYTAEVDAVDAIRASAHAIEGVVFAPTDSGYTTAATEPMGSVEALDVPSVVFDGAYGPPPVMLDICPAYSAPEWLGDRTRTLELLGGVVFDPHPLMLTLRDVAEAPRGPQAPVPVQLPPLADFVRWLCASDANLRQYPAFTTVGDVFAKERWVAHPMLADDALIHVLVLPHAVCVQIYENFSDFTD